MPRTEPRPDEHCSANSFARVHVWEYGKEDQTGKKEPVEVFRCRLCRDKPNLKKMQSLLDQKVLDDRANHLAGAIKRDSQLDAAISKKARAS